MNINLVANCFGSTGYDAHARGLANALNELGHEVHLDCMRPQGWELLVNDAELGMLNNGHFDDGVTVMIGLPPHWPSAMCETHKGFVGYCIWEGDRIPQSFISHILSANAVIVPSTHVEKAFHNTLKERGSMRSNQMHVIPHGVDTMLFKPLERPKTDVFCFVGNKGWSQGSNDRGGVQYLIRAFCEEFRKDEKVLLKLKINGAYCPPGWDLQTELNKLGLPEDRPDMQISMTNVKFEAMPNFYDGDVFVSPTMGEAFSLPCLEAMSCGLPVITTDFGGQTDFVSKFNGWLVKSKSKEVKYDWSYEGVSWAEPDMTDLRKVMRHAFNEREQVKNKGIRARQDAEKLTWEKSAEKLVEVIETII